MNLFYAPELISSSRFYVFDKTESRHISKVLRKKIGEILFLTNGEGDWFEAKIVDYNLKNTKVEIISHRYIEKNQSKIHIAIAPTKSNERFEWFLEKATEIGIDEITPLLTKHSERKRINKERYKRILVAAMKQSLQAYLPRLNEMTKITDFFKENYNEKQRYIAYCKAEEALKDMIEVASGVIILIGPEGGFSENEFLTAVEQGFEPAGLSKNRLRTETAGLVALTTARLKLD